MTYVATQLQKLSKNFSQISFVAAITVSIAFAVIFSVIALHRYWQYEAWYYDFGIFAQAIYSVSKFQAPIIDHFVITDKIIFADHFSPFIFLLSPLFWFTNKPEVLLVAQALMTGVSGMFIFLTAKTVTKNNYLALCLLTIYFSFIGLHFAMITEFHEIALLPLPLSIFFYAMVRQKAKWLIVSALLVLSVKESTFVIPAFFALSEVVKSKGKWRKVNILVLLSSLAYGALVVKVLIPYFAQDTYQYTNDNGTLDKLIDSPLKIRTMWQTLASYGFLPLLAPELLPPVLINWYTRFSLSSVSRHGLVMHYNAEIAPTLLLASIFAVKRLQKWLKKEMIVRIVVSLITVWCVFYSVIVLDSPIRLAVLPDFYRHTSTFKFLDELVEKVPNEGSVMAQANLSPRFIDQRVRMLRVDYEQFAPDWIVLDTRAGQNPNNFYGVEKPEDLFTKLATDPKYEVYYHSGEQFIYKRVK